MYILQIGESVEGGERERWRQRENDNELIQYQCSTKNNQYHTFSKFSNLMSLSFLPTLPITPLPSFVGPLPSVVVVFAIRWSPCKRFPAIFGKLIIFVIH